MTWIADAFDEIVTAHEYGESERGEALSRELLRRVVERGCICDGDTADHHETACYASLPFRMDQRYIEVVFSHGPDSPVMEFVEVEAPRGVSINIGEWVNRSPMEKALRITARAIEQNGAEPTVNAKRIEETL